jgi:hypothetical protein
MANFFESLFGQTPDYSGALAPEQMDALKSNAAKNALIASAVTLLGQSGSQPRQVSTGQAIGAALGAGFGGYQSSFDNTLKQMLAAQQMSDYKLKAEKQKQLAGVMAIADPVERIKALQSAGQYDVIKNIAQSEQELRKSGIMRTPGDLQAPSPFAPFVQSENPNIRTLATEYDLGFKSGRIDEDRADKYLQGLAQMNEQYIARQESAKDRALSRDISSQDRALTRDIAAQERETKRGELSSEQQKQVTGAKNTVNAINEFKTELENFDPRSIASLSPAARAKMQTKYRNMQLQAKEAYNLGVLNGPDLTIIEQLVADPTSYKGAYIGKEGINVQASELSRIVTDMGNVASSKPKTVNAPTQNKNIKVNY